MTEAELAAVVALVREVARAEIMSRFRRLEPGEVQEKTGPLDLVTVADEAAERALTEGLRRLFPGCTVVGEESVSREPALLELIGGAELCFILDPVDGTANFAAGLPLFGVMVAAVRRGVVVGGVIHDPVGDDTAVALAGQGAWIEADGSRRGLRVARPAPVAAMAGTVSYRFMQEPLRSQVCARLPRLGAVWDYRCAAHQYRLMAAGHAHYAVYNRLLPWDHAAGWLIHREAGGYAARLDGSEYSPALFDGGLICAPDRAGWEGLRAALFEISPTDRS